MQLGTNAQNTLIFTAEYSRINVAVCTVFTKQIQSNNQKNYKRKRSRNIK